MFPGKFPQSLLPESGSGVMLAAVLVSLPAFLAWVRSQASSNKVSQENFVRTLEIQTADNQDQSRLTPRKIQAKIDTGADHSLISKAIVDELKLTIERLTENDPSSVLLPDDREFHIQGKIVLRFHVIDSPAPRPTFRFGKYEYQAVFFVPAGADICCFDAYLGTDIIHDNHIQKSYFFSSSGFTAMPKRGEVGFTPEEIAKIEATKADSADRQAAVRAANRAKNQRARDAVLQAASQQGHSNSNSKQASTGASPYAHGQIASGIPDVFNTASPGTPPGGHARTSATGNTPSFQTRAGTASTGHSRTSSLTSVQGGSPTTPARHSRNTSLNTNQGNPRNSPADGNGKNAFGGNGGQK